MQVYAKTATTSRPGPQYLSEEHRKMLEKDSAIAPEIIASSGATTITRGRELPAVFSERQRRRAPGILFEVHRPNGERSWCFRPDKTDPLRPGHKYEQPPKDRGGAGNVLDVLPTQRHLIADTSVPVVFVEGTKKALSLITAARAAGVEVLVVGIVGCWNWLHNGGKPIPDMAAIPLEGRRATVMFDSDMLHKVEVQDAARRLAEYLEKGRGAEVYVTYLRDAPDGSKMGADDFFAREPGGTFEELRLLTRRYDGADFVNIRLSRSARLRAQLVDLERSYAAMPAAKVGECSDRATMRELIRRAESCGKATDGGIVVRAAVRTLATKTRLSTRSQLNSLRRLEEGGYLKRIEEPKCKGEEKGAAYLLCAECTGRALGKQHRTERGQQQNASKEHNQAQEQRAEENPLRYADLYAGVYLARASAHAGNAVPELRHSKVVHTWARNRDGRRVVVDSSYVYRLAKPRQEVLMYLVEVGGEASEAELLERFGSPRTRMRDFHRRKISPLLGWRYSRDKETGTTRRLEVGPPIVTYEEGMVRILPDWREALEEHRRQSGEHEDNERQAERYKRQSEAYRNRDRTPANDQPHDLKGKGEMRRIVEERRREEKARWVEEQRKKVGITAATFLADELEGITAVRFVDVRQRWAVRGGSVEELRRAVMYGPWRFKREEEGDLYIYREDASSTEYIGPTERLWRDRRQPSQKAAAPVPERRLAPQVKGVHVHGPACDCWLCEEEDAEPRYVQLAGAPS
jgi:hypothetical protein